MSKLMLGLPKGNVISKSREFISRYLHSSPGNKLHISGNDVEITLMKQRDIPRMITMGIIDAGITSTEWIRETDSNLFTIYRTNWCDTRISLIQSSSDLSHPIRTCVTEYPNLAANFFKDNQLQVDVYKVSGSTEAFVPWAFDCSIDCVETGGTLLENGLIEKETLLFSSTLLVANPNIDTSKLKHVIQVLKEMEDTYDNL